MCEEGVYSLCLEPPNLRRGLATGQAGLFCCLAQHIDQLKLLAGTTRPRRCNQHLVAYFARVLLIMKHQLSPASHVLFVARVLYQPLYGANPRLAHTVAGDNAPNRSGFFGLVVHFALPSLGLICTRRLFAANG